MPGDRSALPRPALDDRPGYVTNIIGQGEVVAVVLLRVHREGAEAAIQGGVSSLPRAFQLLIDAQTGPATRVGNDEASRRAGPA